MGPLIAVTALNVHPVKSTAIRPVTSAEVRPAGLAGDRHWMVVDEAGVLVSARELRTLFSVVSDVPATDPSLSTALRLRAPGLSDLLLDVPEGESVPVTMFRHQLLAIPYGAEVTAWLAAATGADGLRLVWCDDPTRRALNPEFGRSGDHTAFADGYPVTLASADSLTQLNEWIGEEPVPMTRFRPNVVVEGAAPFAEDAWTRIRIGDVWFRKPKGVDRCAMTLIDPDDLSTGKEPIRTLSRHRLRDGKTWFAIQLIPETTGTISVGDVVEPGDVA